MTKNETCKVSICIPTYNQPEFVESALHSCLKQTFTDFEIVICDDSQGDNVESIVHQYAKIDQRIHYLHNPQPLGAAANSNRTVECAVGEWIKFLYQDDEFSDGDSLQRLVDCSCDCDFIVSPSICKNEGKTQIHRLSPAQLDMFRRDPVAALFRYGNIIGAPSATMIKKACLKPFDLRLVWMFDLAMYLEVASDKIIFKVLFEPVVIINQHLGQLTHQVSGFDDIETFESLVIYSKIRYRSYSTGSLVFLVQKLINHGSKLSFQHYLSILSQFESSSFFIRTLWFVGRFLHIVTGASKGFKSSTRSHNQLKLV